MARHASSLCSILAATFIAASAFAVPLAQAASQQDRETCSKGNGDAQIAGCTHIIEDKSESARVRAIAYYNRGNTYSIMGDRDRAVADYNQAIKLDPNYAPAYYNRGVARSSQKDKTGAIADLQKAAELGHPLADKALRRLRAEQNSAEMQSCDGVFRFLNKDIKAYLVGNKRAAYCQCYEKSYDTVFERYAKKKGGIDKLTSADGPDILKITLSYCLDRVKEYFGK